MNVHHLMDDEQLGDFCMAQLEQQFLLKLSSERCENYLQSARALLHASRPYFGSEGRAVATHFQHVLELLGQEIAVIDQMID